VRGSDFPEPSEPPLSAGPVIGANPSFADLLRSSRPEAAPQIAPLPPEMRPAHGTTVIGLKFADGIVMAGDRRATEGFSIADRRMEKVFPADEFSAVAIAGAAGPAVDIVRLLQVELEHYEKLEGDRLSLEGKANRLAQMIKQNFPLAMQGLVVVPLFGGYDLRRAEGRIFRYDAVGGRYEDIDFHATGSGGVHAKASLKKSYRPDLGQADAVRAAIEALVDASDEDAATGGPDLERNIFPIVALVTTLGYSVVPDSELRPVVEAILSQRGRN